MRNEVVLCFAVSTDVDVFVFLLDFRSFDSIFDVKRLSKMKRKTEQRQEAKHEQRKR